MPQRPSKETSKKGGSRGRRAATLAEPPSPTPLKQAVSSQAQQQQQHLLDVFANALRPALTSPDLESLKQEAKGALYERDFARAFSRPDLLAAYAARWSPTRALCYAEVFAAVFERLRAGEEGEEEGEGEDERKSGRGRGESGGGVERERKGEGEGEGQKDCPRALGVLALGGGPAELGGLAAAISRSATFEHADVSLVDVAPWGPLCEQLRSHLAAPLPPTPYFRHPRPPVAEPSVLAHTFTQADMLMMQDDDLIAHLAPARLVTLLFTLNELLTSAGAAKTSEFLLHVTRRARPGTLLLVVDSPGSYGEVAIGHERGRRPYPMSWFLDHVLLSVGGGRCEKVEGRESAWFRLEAGARYPIELEDMRYQLHLYRVVRSRVDQDGRQG